MYQKKPEDRICKKCGVRGLPNGSNLITRDRGKYFRSLCKKCGVIGLKSIYHQISYKDRDPEYKKATNYRRRRDRSINNPSYILGDCKRFDKRHGHRCDIDTQFVSQETEKGCVYCGAKKSELKISLDRIDNSLGHTKENVVPACTICNLTRGNMPYEAWLVVAKGMREARELELFEGWIPGNKRKY